MNAHAQVQLEQTHVRWRADDGVEGSTGASWLAPEDVRLAGVPAGAVVRLRLQVANRGSSSSGPVRLGLQEASGASCDWAAFQTVGAAPSGSWRVVDSRFLQDGAATANVNPGLTDEGASFVPGQVRDSGAETAALDLAPGSFTEVEFALQAQVVASGEHCFRLHEVTSARALDNYRAYAQVSVCPGYSFRKPVSVRRSAVGEPTTTTLSDFPLLFDVADPHLVASALGGHVASGRDLAFRAFDDATCGGVGASPCTLDHEVERYDAATGRLTAWVRVPSLNGQATSVDTRFYLYYGDVCPAVSGHNPTRVWEARYRGVWHLQEPSSPTQDSTAFLSDGTWVGALSAAPARVNDGVSMPGVGRVEVPDSLALDITGAEVSVSMWVNPRVSGRNTHLLHKSVNLGGYLMVLSEFSRGMFLIYHGSGYVSTGTPCPVGQWTHLVGTYNQAGQMRLFRNGLVADTAPGSGAIATSRTGDLYLGRRGWQTSNNFELDGMLDEVRVFAGERSAAWVATEYANVTSPGILDFTPGQGEERVPGADGGTPTDGGESGEDLGAARQPRRLKVGCGCQGSGGAATALLLLLARRARRPRR